MQSSAAKITQHKHLLIRHFLTELFIYLFSPACPHQSKMLLDLVALMALASRRLASCHAIARRLFPSEGSTVLSSVVRCMSNTTDKALYDEPLEGKHGDAVMR